MLRSVVVHSPLRLTPGVAAGQFPALVLNSLGLYLKLMFLPFWHQPYYPFRPDFLTVNAYGIAASLFGAAVLLLLFRFHLRTAFAGGWWALLFLLPVANLLFLSGPIAAERFLYLPSFGLILVPAMLLNRLQPGSRARALGGIVILLSAAFALNAARTSRVWRSDLSLAQAMTRATPDFPMAHHRLGVALKYTGNPTGAAAEFRQAVKLKPDYAEAHTSLGTLLEAQGDLPAAIAEYRMAVQYDSTYVVARNNLGSAYGNAGNADSALAQFAVVLEIDPGNPEAHNNLGVALYSLGRVDQAREHFNRALQSRPGYLKAIVNLARLLLAEGKQAEATPLVERAIKLAPDDPAVRALRKPGIGR
jgi:Flp pilus assembly protein TadD